jgi:hypothetical protein
LRIENTQPDQRVSGGVRYFYFTGYALPVPAGAMNVAVVTAEGTALEFTNIATDGDTLSWIEFSFARDLRYGKVVDVTISFDMVGGAPRSDDLSRMNPAVSSFPVFSFGEPGKTTVRVNVPIGLNTETLGDEMVSSVAPGVNVYTAEAIENPDDWYAFFTTRNDARLVETTLEVGDAKFAIRSWPGDDQWTTFMSNIVTTGLPALEELTGQTWPHSTPFSLIESLSPYLYGYAGWYDGAAEQIEVGEELDDEVMLHELSHAWFNSDAFTERWLNEGLAEAFAIEAMNKLGKTSSEQPDVSLGDPAAIRLAIWNQPFGTDEEIEELEDFGYAASRLVMTRIVKQMGEEKMRLVLAAAIDGDIPYVGEGEPESMGKAADDWRRFLDLAQEIGDSTVAESLMREWVVRNDQLPLLDDRAEARTAYDELEAADGDWAMPVGVRRSMTAWDFVRATERMESAHEVLDARDKLLTTIEPLQIDLPTGEIETAYEAEDTDQSEALASIDDFNATAEKLLASDAEVDAERSTLEKIGLWGKTPQVDQDAALAKFEKGDLAGVAVSTQAVTDVFADAEALGKKRAMTAGGGVLGFLALSTLTGVSWRRRRKRRRAADQAATAAAVDADRADVEGLEGPLPAGTLEGAQPFDERDISSKSPHDPAEVAAEAVGESEPTFTAGPFGVPSQLPHPAAPAAGPLQSTSATQPLPMPPTLPSSGDGFAR